MKEKFSMLTESQQENPLDEWDSDEEMDDEWQVDIGKGASDDCKIRDTVPLENRVAGYRGLWNRRMVSGVLSVCRMRKPQVKTVYKDLALVVMRHFTTNNTWQSFKDMYEYNLPIWNQATCVLLRRLGVTTGIACAA